MRQSERLSRTQGLALSRSNSLAPVVHAGGSLAGKDSCDASSTGSQVSFSEELTGGDGFSGSFAAEFFFSEGMAAFPKTFHLKLKHNSDRSLWT